MPRTPPPSRSSVSAGSAEGGVSWSDLGPTVAGAGPRPLPSSPHPCEELHKGPSLLLGDEIRKRFRHGLNDLNDSRKLRFVRRVLNHYSCDRNTNAEA